MEKLFNMLIALVGTIIVVALVPYILGTFDGITAASFAEQKYTHYLLAVLIFYNLLDSIERRKIK